MQFISKKSAERWARKERLVLGASGYKIHTKYVRYPDRTCSLAYVVSFRFN